MEMHTQGQSKPYDTDYTPIMQKNKASELPCLDLVRADAFKTVK